MFAATSWANNIHDTKTNIVVNKWQYSDVAQTSADFPRELPNALFLPYNLACLIKRSLPRALDKRPFHPYRNRYDHNHPL